MAGVTYCADADGSGARVTRPRDSAMTPTKTHAASAAATQPLPRAMDESLLRVPPEHHRSREASGGADDDERERR